MTTLVPYQEVKLSNLSETFCKLVSGKWPLIQLELQTMAWEQLIPMSREHSTHLQGVARTSGSFFGALDLSSLASSKKFLSKVADGFMFLISFVLRFLQ